MLISLVGAALVTRLAVRRFVALRFMAWLVVGPLLDANQRVVALRRWWVGPLLLRLPLALVAKGQVFSHLVTPPAIPRRPLPPVVRLPVLLLGLPLGDKKLGPFFP